MTFKGEEIVVPTIYQIGVYIAEKGYNISAKDFYEHYSEKGWLTLKNTPIKKLEAAIDSFNGSAILKELNRNREKSIEKVNVIRDIKNSRVIKHNEIPYSKQLRDKRWYSYRTKILNIYHNRCAKCGRKEDLQVHHIRYIRGRYAWEYNINDVIVLCRECHKKEHHIDNDFISMIK